jgi:hypothetical protein
MSELVISFTAARDLDDQGREVVLNVLTALPLADRYVTGACIGGDAFIGGWLFEHRPDAHHLVIVPADRSRVDPWWYEVSPSAVLSTYLMPPGTSYADRNAELVKQGTMLFGFPAYPEDDPRSVRSGTWQTISGTWQTIRMARKAGKLSQWHCVKPPYAGRVEKWPSEFCRPPHGEFGYLGGESAP